VPSEVVPRLRTIVTLPPPEVSIKVSIGECCENADWRRNGEGIGGVMIWLTSRGVDVVECRVRRYGLDRANEGMINPSEPLPIRGS
jgi:hypothetical protein